MLRRLLLVLSTLSVVLSVHSRPAASAPDEHHHLHTRSKSGEPFSPVIVPVGDPAMLLGRQYQVVKREPSPLIIMSPAFETAIGQPKGEKPPTPMPTMMKRTLLPRYLAQREHVEANYLSNVKPGPVYPSYAPYEPPHVDVPTPTSLPTVPSATGEPKPHTENVKDRTKSKSKAKESKKHKSG